MSRPVFHSGFADEINLYLDYKIASGYKEKSFCIILKSFDTFCFQRKINKVVLPVLMQMHGLRKEKKKQLPTTIPESTR